MTKQSKSFYSLFTIYQRSLLLQGLTCLGGLGFLGTDVAWAQTTNPSAIAPAVEPGPAAPLAPVELPAEQPAPVVVLDAPEQFAPEAAAPLAPDVPLEAVPAPTVTLSTPAKESLATETYDAPSAVVLSERSTGCKAVLKPGQGLSGDTCAIEAAANPRPIPVISVSSSQSAAAVRVGPLNLSYSGIGIGTSPAVRNYYNRTLRPPGKLGNGNIRLIFPLSIPAPITSLFGWRVHPISGDRRFHAGTDIGAPLGTPVLAAYAGRVMISDFLGGYGLTVTLEHNKGTQETLYAHLSEIFVRPGEWIPQGAVIGRVGSTGNSTGPHLHFEFRQLTDQGWVALDPGAQLEYALAQLVKALQTADANSRPKV